MMKDASFEVHVTVEDCRRFAEVSGDWNPLHTDPEYANQSAYERQVLHGAYSAGLISRLAGMYLPGKDCLLYGLKMRFVCPILPPATLKVKGHVVSFSNDVGRVVATISDGVSGLVYVDASYEFGSHRLINQSRLLADASVRSADDDPFILVTGASGGLGKALLKQLGGRGRAVRRSEVSGRVDQEYSLEVPFGEYQQKISAIVHCAWPMPDNRTLTSLDDPTAAIDQQIAGPLKDIQTLASFLARKGMPNAPLILVGSTFASSGRHYFRMPLYSLAKAMVPTLVDILALELSVEDKRCIGVVFDMLDGGMNKGLSTAARQANADRNPWGELATVEDAASQIVWLLNNQSRLISGAVVKLTSGSIP